MEIQWSDPRLQVLNQLLLPVQIVRFIMNQILLEKGRLPVDYALRIQDGDLRNMRQSIQPGNFHFQASRAKDILVRSEECRVSATFGDPPTPEIRKPADRGADPAQRK